MTSFVKITFVITLVGICTANDLLKLTPDVPAIGLTPDVPAIGLTPLGDPTDVYNVTSNTPENIVHHYVEKILNEVEKVEDKLVDTVRKEISYFTDGISYIFYGLFLFAGITLAIISCGNLHLCCSMLKSERDKHKFIKEIIGKRKEPEATDKTDETTTV